MLGNGDEEGACVKLGANFFPINDALHEQVD
jgi:hypothetical protein